MPRIGLIIQGPLLSTGRTGKTIGVEFEKVEKSHIVDFDATDNVRIILNSALVPQSIAVVWDGEEPDRLGELFSAFGHERILRLPQVARTPLPKGAVIPGNNQYRQIFSIIRGFEFLKSRGCEYGIKVRSDQLLSIDKLVEDCSSIWAIAPEALVCPFLNGKLSRSIPDFYLGGRLDDMISKLSRIYAYRVEIKNIHEELFYQFAAPRLVRRPFGRRILRLRFFDFLARNAWGTKLFPASRSLYEKVQWRGELIEVPNGLKFLEDFWGDPAEFSDSIRSKTLIQTVRNRISKKFSS